MTVGELKKLLEHVADETEVVKYAEGDRRMYSTTPCLVSVRREVIYGTIVTWIASRQGIEEVLLVDGEG